MATGCIEDPAGNEVALSSARRDNTSTFPISSRRITSGIILSLIVGFLFRTMIVQQKNKLEYDDTIAYLAAACHQLAYQEAARDFTPKPATYWKSFMQPDDVFCFQTIAEGVAQDDIHPPLYFWLLHVWMLLFGAHVWAGISLNIVISTLATLALFGLSRQVMRLPSETLLVTLSYALNPSVILISKEARPHDLLALLTLLTVWQLLRTSSQPNARNYILLSLAITAGMLTHYQFVLVILGCLLLLLGSYLKGDSFGSVRSAASVSSGFLIAFIIHPYFFSSVWGLTRIKSGMTYPLYLERLGKLVTSFVTIYYIVFVLVILSVVGVYSFLQQRERFDQRCQQISQSERAILFLLAWLTGAISLMYLGFISPAHSMGSSKYWALVWPFWAFLPSIISRLFSFRKSVVSYFWLIPLVYTVLFPLFVNNLHSPDSGESLGTTTMVIVDSRLRGVFFQILWQLPDSSLVIAADQDDLLAHPKKWLGYLRDDNLYISDVYAPNTEQQQAQILGLLWDSGYTTARIPDHFSSTSTTFHTFAISSR